MFRKMLKSSNKGFTIIELVIVVAVIGILSGILIPTFMNLTKDAEYSNDVAQLNSINKVIAMEDVYDNSPNDAIELENLLEEHNLSLQTKTPGLYYFYSKETGRVVLASLDDNGIIIKVDNSPKTYSAVNNSSIYTGDYLSEILSPEEFIDGYLFVTTHSSDGFAQAISGIREGNLDNVGNVIAVNPNLATPFNYLVSTSIFIDSNNNSQSRGTGNKTNVVISRQLGKTQESAFEVSQTVLPKYYYAEVDSETNYFPFTSAFKNSSETYYIKDLNGNYFPYAGDFYINTGVLRKANGVFALDNTTNPPVGYRKLLYWPSKSFFCFGSQSTANSITSSFQGTSSAHVNFQNVDYYCVSENSTTYKYIGNQIYAYYNNQLVPIDSYFYGEVAFSSTDVHLPLYQPRSTNIKIIDIPSNVSYITPESEEYLASLNEDIIITYGNSELMNHISDNALKARMVKVDARSSVITKLRIKEVNATNDLINDKITIKQALKSNGALDLTSGEFSSNYLGHDTSNGVKSWTFNSFLDTNYNPITLIDNEASTIALYRKWDEDSTYNGEGMCVYNDLYYKFNDIVDQIDKALISTGDVILMDNNTLNVDLTVPQGINFIVPFKLPDNGYTTDALVFHRTNFEYLGELVVDKDNEGSGGITTNGKKHYMPVEGNERPGTINEYTYLIDSTQTGTHFTVKTGKTLTMEGNLIVSGYYHSNSDAPRLDALTSNYGILEIETNAKVISKSKTMIYGIATGAGELEIDDSELYEYMALPDFPEGNVANNDSIILSYLTQRTMPFKKWCLPNNSVTTTIHGSHALLAGLPTIAAHLSGMNSKNKFELGIVTAIDFPIMSGAGNDKSAFGLSNNANVTVKSSVINDENHLIFEVNQGTFTDKQFDLGLERALKSMGVSSRNQILGFLDTYASYSSGEITLSEALASLDTFDLPLYNMEIRVKSGAELDLNYLNINLFADSKIVVDSGATMVIGNASGTRTSKVNNIDGQNVIVNGTLNIKSTASVGFDILSETTGATVILTSTPTAKLTATSKIVANNTTQISPTLVNTNTRMIFLDGDEVPGYLEISTFANPSGTVTFISNVKVTGTGDVYYFALQQ